MDTLSVHRWQLHRPTVLIIMLNLNLAECRIASRCIAVHLANVPPNNRETLYKDEQELLDKLLDYEQEIMLSDGKRQIT